MLFIYQVENIRTYHGSEIGILTVKAQWKKISIIHPATYLIRYQAAGKFDVFGKGFCYRPAAGN